MSKWFYVRVIYVFSVLIYFLCWLVLSEGGIPSLFLSLNLLIVGVLAIDYKQKDEIYENN